MNRNANRILIAIAWWAGLTIGAMNFAWGEGFSCCTREAVNAKVSARGLEKSFDFLEKMAQEGCVWSYYLLSARYEDTESKERVLFLLRESGRMGDERSLRRLGSYHSFGVGKLDKDFVMAYGLYRLAGYLGDKGTDFLAYKLSLNMSDAEIIMGDKLFRAWQDDWDLNKRIDRDL